MTEKDPRLIETSDGSHSIYLPWLRETYHSSHGAITESRHVFIKAGLDYYNDLYNPDQIKIFEVGFGTGLNALLSFQWSNTKNKKISYSSIEQYPLPEEISDKLNYGKLLNGEEVSLKKLHAAPWDQEVQVSETFILKKIKGEWKNYTAPEKDFNVIFYDAFAPSKQPDMWTADLIQKSYNMLTEKGILVTYCAQGQFKRDLKAAGFEVETIPGPPGKKEMVRGRAKG